MFFFFFCESLFPAIFETSETNIILLNANYDHDDAVLNFAIQTPWLEGPHLLP